MVDDSDFRALKTAVIVLGVIYGIMLLYMLETYIVLTIVVAFRPSDPEPPRHSLPPPQQLPALPPAYV